MQIGIHTPHPAISCFCDNFDACASCYMRTSIPRDEFVNRIHFLVHTRTCGDLPWHTEMCENSVRIARQVKGKMLSRLDIDDTMRFLANNYASI